MLRFCIFKVILLAVVFNISVKTIFLDYYENSHCYQPNELI